jgi:hypothetical protein
MRSSSVERTVWLVLGSLALIDLTIGSVALFDPALWFRVFHNAPYVDPQALAPRMGAHWAGFFLVQSIALVRWRTDSRWLLLVAGARLSDVFTDLTCLLLCQSISPFGRLALASAGPANLLAAWLLWRCHGARVGQQL